VETLDGSLLSKKNSAFESEILDSDDDMSELEKEIMKKEGMIKKSYSHVMNFKDFKGLKMVENIRDRYKVGQILG